MSSYALATIFMIACCLAIGCSPKPTTTGKLVWNLSKSRTIDQVSGGEWLAESKRKYYIHGDRNLRIAIVLDAKRRFDFDSARHIYVYRSSSKITTIKIASFGYSKQGAIERLKEMHQQWDGVATGDLEEWIKQTDKGYLGNFGSSIHHSVNLEDPNISACIHYNFGDKNNDWYIMTTFLWPDPRFKQLTPGIRFRFPKEAAATEAETESE